VWGQISNIVFADCPDLMGSRVSAEAIFYKQVKFAQRIALVVDPVSRMHFWESRDHARAMAPEILWIYQPAWAPW